ncbi:MAG: hypothetical protein JWN93_3424 [Hyphomicrobiales bacterium]|nr:hypothetical protein [Hyphomicrobiales bacterium]
MEPVLHETVPGRACGSCMMCCKSFPVAELAKPAGRWCTHAKAGRGCSIHDARPGTCSAFFCVWMRNPTLGEEWKPDRAKFVMSSFAGSEVLAITVDPAQPSAWKREPYHSAIRGWAGAAIEARSQVLLINGGRVSVILPNTELDVGVLSPGDQIALSHDGQRFHARVVKAA